MDRNTPPFAASIVRAAELLTLSLSPFHPLSRYLCLIASPGHCCDTFPHIHDKMLAIGRGAIAHVQYTGDEAAGEIKKLLDAVVSTHRTTTPTPSY